MAVNRETIERIRKMPDLVGRIKTEVLPIVDVAYTLPTVHTILSEESYAFSQQQNGILVSGYNEFKKDREGVLYTLQGNNIDRVKENLAQQHKIDVGDIEGITVHPTSLTFALNPTAFVKVYDPKRKLRNDGYTYHDFPLGFTNNGFIIPIDGYHARYSFRDSKRSDEMTAEHENLHVIYIYLHPFRSEPLPTQEEEIEFAQNAYREQDEGPFEGQLHYLSFWQMYRYLDELTAYSLRGKGIIYKFVGDQADKDYIEAYNDSLTALRKGLPDNVKERFGWERMIWEANTRLTHWMQFVDKEYRDILEADANVPFDEHTNILLTLTPDRAYLLRFFNPRYADAPPNALVQWRREYHHGWKPQTAHERVKDWTEFFINTLDLEDTEILPALREFNGQVQSRKRDLIWQGKPNTDNHGRYYADKSFDSDNLEEVTEAVKSVIAGKMSRSIGVYEDFLEQQALSEDEKKTVRARIAKHIFNAHELFSQFIESYQRINNTYEGEDIKEMNAHKDIIPVWQDGVKKDELALVKRSLDIEDAAAEMMEAYMSGQEIDLDQVFQPGFRRSDEKYERLINLLLNDKHETTNGVSPFDDEVRGFFRSHFFSGMVLISYEGRTLTFDEVPRKVASALTRILLWAREKNISDERITKIKEYFLALQKGKNIPHEYQILIGSASVVDVDTQ